MKKSRSGPSSPENILRMVSGSITVNVAEASIDMFTPPCSPNSWRAAARDAAGSSCVEDGNSICFFVVMKLLLSSKSSDPLRFLLSEITKLLWDLVSAMISGFGFQRAKDFDLRER